MGSSVQNYQIRVEGHLSDNWSSRFYDLDIRREEQGFTIISGELPDQTALHGVLMMIRDLGLKLVEVKCVDCDSIS